MFVSVFVFHDLEIGRSYSSDVGLLGALLDGQVDRRAQVTLQRGTATLGLPVDIDGEEVVLAVQRLPLGGEGLAARVPGKVGRVDAAGVVLQGRAGENLVGIQRATRVGLAQTQNVGPVQVSDADIATGLAAILLVEGVDGSESVVDAAYGLDGGSQGGERDVGIDDAVVGGAVVVLDLLEEQDVGGLEVVVDVAGDVLDVLGVAGGKVLNAVVADSDA